MAESISVLILEDYPDDAELMVRQLHQTGFALVWQRMESRADYEAMLFQAATADPALDLILADYNLPQFNALQALQLLQARDLDIPFIVVTGSINEEVAVECMKQGAADYVLKDHLQRLGPAVIQALAQKQLREAKQQAEEKYRRIFENASEGIFQITPAGQLLTANPALARIGGCASVEELLTNLNDGAEFYFNPSQWAEFTRLVEEQGEVCRFEAPSYRPDGSLIWVSANGRAVRAVTGQILYYEGTIEDITERKRAEQERERLIEELDAFAHMVAHDLKNPLAVVTGTAQVLEDSCPDLSTVELKDCLQTILRMGDKMNNIIDELLLLAKVRQQGIEPQPLDMNRIIAEAQQRLNQMITTSQAEIIAPATWPTVLGHGPWIEEVWVNYLSNAIKYGGQPPRLELGATGREDGQVCFWVRDNGPGLTPQEQTHLFSPFTRLNHGQGQGHGLGLSIVRRIVEKLGGQVGVESNGTAGQGSVFSFTLPGTTEGRRA